MVTGFQGFAADSFRFFEELARHNHKAWFDENRTRYDEHVVGAFRGLLRALTPFVLKLNPHFETGGKTNGNFSRINRDIRFSKDKSPYKPNFYLYVYDGRHDRGHAGRLYVGLSADCLTVGFSIYGSWRGPKGALETVFRKRAALHRPPVRATPRAGPPRPALRNLLAPRGERRVDAARGPAAPRGRLADAPRLGGAQGFPSQGARPGHSRVRPRGRAHLHGTLSTLRLHFRYDSPMAVRA